MHFSVFDQLGEGGQHSITIICSPCPCNSGGWGWGWTEMTGWGKTTV